MTSTPSNTNNTFGGSSATAVVNTNVFGGGGGSGSGHGNSSSTSGVGSGSGSSNAAALRISNGSRKPVLVGKVEGFTDDLNDAVLIPGEDGVITAGDDKTVQVWLKRDSGQYWPSICQYVPSQASCIHVSFWDDNNGQQSSNSNQHSSSGTSSNASGSTTTNRLVFIGLDNGTISEYSLAADCNKLDHRRDYLSHIGRVTGVVYDVAKFRLLTVARDKCFQWADSRNSNVVGTYTLTAWATAIQFDKETDHVFIGDYSGAITMLKLGGGTVSSHPTSPIMQSSTSTTAQQQQQSTSNLITCVTTFKGHSGSIRSLLWERNMSYLFSGSFDTNVCVWDIGGKKGTVFELQGHKGKVTGLSYMSRTQQLISGGEDAILVAWNMKTPRVETPDWKESDFCQICKNPFFWNIKAMFESKTIGQRQHHCRACGKAVCDKCSGKKTPIPKMGFEFAVRVCDHCYSNNQIVFNEQEKASLASFHESKHSVVTLHLDEARNLLVTVGSDRVIKIWDVSSLNNVNS